MNVEYIRNSFSDELANENFVIDKTSVKTLEIQGASFEANEPLIFGPLNHEYIKRELNWYNSMSLNVDDIEGKVPAIWQSVSTPSGEINSNYGWCVWSDSNNCTHHNGAQYWNVVKELRLNPDSRRAIMIYTRPTMHTDYNRDGMSDFICTNTVQYLIRNDELVVIVQMRSNDVVFGYRNDYAWQDYVAGLVSTSLRLTSHKIIWQVGSLHIYEKHFWMVEAWDKLRLSSITKEEYEKVWGND